MAAPLQRARAVVAARPAETGTAGTFAVLVAVLTSAGVEPERAAAIAGVVAAVAPAVITRAVTWWRSRHQRPLTTLPPV